MRTTVGTQPQIIIVACCITLRRSAYGAWGNYSVHGADGKKATDVTFIGHINPLRYRGYYYDRETRLYYLQSRYYDFANCRFINADVYTSTDVVGFLECNMFAYCSNSPINNKDSDGGFCVPAAIVGGVIHAALTIAGACIDASINNEAIDYKALLWDTAFSFALGAIQAGSVLKEVGYIVNAFNIGKSAFDALCDGASLKEVLIRTAITAVGTAACSSVSRQFGTSKVDRVASEIASGLTQGSIDSLEKCGDIAYRRNKPGAPKHYEQSRNKNKHKAPANIHALGA